MQPTEPTDQVNKNTKDQRQFHTEETSKYWLPMDNEEIIRLNKVCMNLLEIDRL